MTDTTISGNENALFNESELPLQFPPFDRISAEDFLPAFERGMAEQLNEIAEIAGQANAPDFENTMTRLERSGQMLERVSIAFYTLSSADTSDAIDAVEVEIAPRLSAHRDQILLDEQLFARVKDIHERRHDLGLDAESLRLVEERYKDFVRAGAELNAAQKEQLPQINRELAELSTRFSQNVLDEVNALAVVVDSREAAGGKGAGSGRRSRIPGPCGQVRAAAAQYQRPARPVLAAQSRAAPANLRNLRIAGASRRGIRQP